MAKKSANVMDKPKPTSAKPASPKPSKPAITKPARIDVSKPVAPANEAKTEVQATTEEVEQTPPAAQEDEVQVNVNEESLVDLDDETEVEEVQLDDETLAMLADYTAAYPFEDCFWITTDKQVFLEHNERLGHDHQKSIDGGKAAVYIVK